MSRHNFSYELATHRVPPTVLGFSCPPSRTPSSSPRFFISLNQKNRLASKYYTPCFQPQPVPWSDRAAVFKTCAIRVVSLFHMAPSSYLVPSYLVPKKATLSPPPLDSEHFWPRNPACRSRLPPFPLFRIAFFSGCSELYILDRPFPSNESVLFRTSFVRVPYRVNFGGPSFSTLLTTTPESSFSFRFISLTTTSSRGGMPRLSSLFLLSKGVALH